MLKSFSTPGYLNFIKNYQTYLKFLKGNTKFLIFCICKIYTNSFIIYQSFLNNFLMILKFPRSFFEYSSIFFKISTNRQFLSLLLTVYQVFFLKIPQFFFKDLRGVLIKLQLKFAHIFILVYLKISLQVSEVI